MLISSSKLYFTILALGWHRRPVRFGHVSLLNALKPLIYESITYNKCALLLLNPFLLGSIRGSHLLLWILLLVFLLLFSTVMYMTWVTIMYDQLLSSELSSQGRVKSLHSLHLVLVTQLLRYVASMTTSALSNQRTLKPSCTSRSILGIFFTS